MKKKTEGKKHCKGCLDKQHEGKDGWIRKEMHVVGTIEHPTPIDTNPQWEKEFDRKFGKAEIMETDDVTGNRFDGYGIYEELKDFIRSLLHTAKQEERKRTIEDVRKVMGNGATRDEVKKRLDSLKESK